MAALPDGFLATVIAEVATLKGIVDSNKVVKEKDPTVTACAKIAYTQICQYCHRPFHYGERTEFYDDYVGPTLLRSIPIDRQKPAALLVDGKEFKSNEFKVVRGRLVIRDETTTDTGNIRFPNMEFISTAGIKLLEDNNTLYTAVMMQTIANYHRRNAYGLSETSGEKGVSVRPIDSGDIIDSVKSMLDGLIYNGTGYTMDGE